MRQMRKSAYAKAGTEPAYGTFPGKTWKNNNVWAKFPPVRHESQCLLGAGAVTLAELVDATAGIDDLVLARIERV